MVNGKILRGPEIDTHCVTSQAVRTSLNAFLDGCHRKAGKVHAASGILIAIALHIRPARGPAGPEEDDSARGNLPVAIFPIVERASRDLIIGIRGSLRAHVDDDGHAQKLRCGNLVDSGLARREM